MLGAGNFVGLGLDALGHPIVGNLAGQLLQFPTGGTVYRTIGNPYPFSQLLVDDGSGSSTKTSTNTTTTTTVTTYSAAHFRVQTSTRRAGCGRAWMRAYGLLPGESFVVRYGARVVGCGFASTTGTLRVKVKLPKRLGAWRWVRVTGYNSARTGAIKLKSTRAGCRR